MKKFSSALVITLALVTLLSSAAFAGDDAATCSIAKAPGKCCIESAAQNKACCGQDAKTVAAKVANYNASQAALGDMHECCAEAVVAGKGCCGKDAATVQAAYAKNLATCKTVLASMDECCANAYVKGEGCCGKDAATLKANTGKACDATNHAKKRLQSTSSSK